MSHSTIGSASCAILISDIHIFLLADNRTYHFQAEDEKDMIKYVFVYVIPMIICICNYLKTKIGVHFIWLTSVCNAQS